MESDRTYIQIMIDSVKNKIHVLGKLIELTEAQTALVKSDNPGAGEFDGLLDEKDRQIDILNMLDEGFVNVYDKVKSSVESNPRVYKDELVLLQKLIDEAVALGSRLEALEYSNRELIEAFLCRKKADIRQFRNSRNMSGSYYRNMPNQHMEGDSYFMNQRK